MLEFSNVSVCYEPHKRHPVKSLDDFSLRVENGEWAFLVGPSGAGKSSLLKLLYAGVRADEGKVLVDGHDITRLPDREIPALRRKIGIVFQDFALLPHRTAWENVAFALRVIGVRQDTIVRAVPRALEIVDLAHRADALPHELSGGEQQRIAIARAIVNDPPLLLADEPTGNLDPETAAQIGALLARINKERGTTILMATHDRVLVDSMRRRVVRLREGRLVSDENPGVYHPEDDLTTSGAPNSSNSRDSKIASSPNKTDSRVSETPSNVISTDSGDSKMPLNVVSKPAGGDSQVERALDNEAPLGSPENPIVVEE